MSQTILNFIPIGAGGGLQNSLSFLDTLASDENKKSKCMAVVRRASALHQLCRRRNIDYLSFPDSKLARLACELTCRGRFSRGQTCFSIFGPPLLRSAGYFLNVNGCAYSNLFYPEIDFWQEHSFSKRKERWWVDLYRRRMTAKADYWIFETEALRQRAIELCGFPPSRVSVVRMAPSSLVSPQKVDADASRAFAKRIPGGFRFLFLAGAHPNKRLASLPEIAAELEKRGHNEFVFVTTMPEQHGYAVEIAAKFRALGMEERLCNIGPVPPAQASSLIDCVDAMCTFSRLESFSNNFIEAWRMGKPLLVTDADWARDSCGEAALYVDPENAAESARSIAELMNSSTLRDNLAFAGAKQLAIYPTPAEKLNQYFRCIEEAQRLGPCPVSEKQKIRWPKCKTS